MHRKELHRNVKDVIVWGVVLFLGRFLQEAQEGFEIGAIVNDFADGKHLLEFLNEDHKHSWVFIKFELFLLEVRQQCVILHHHQINLDHVKKDNAGHVRNAFTVVFLYSLCEGFELIQERVIEHVLVNVFYCFAELLRILRGSMVKEGAFEI